MNKTMVIQDGHHRAIALIEAGIPVIVSYLDCNNIERTVTLHNARLEGSVLRGEQKIRGRMVNRSIHWTEITTKSESKRND